MLIITNDGYLIDTEKNVDGCFEEEIIWNGYARVGRCSQFTYGDSRQYLFSTDDRYYLAQITVDSKTMFASRICFEHATKWLLFNNHRNLPDNLRHIPNTLI